VLTAHDDEPYIQALLGAGADGYMLKTATSSKLVKGIRDETAGLTPLSPAVTRTVVRRIAEPIRVTLDSPVDGLTE